MHWIRILVPALTELAFFNQWILTERRSGGVKHITSILVIVYAAMEPLACWIITATNPQFDTLKLVVQFWISGALHLAIGMVSHHASTLKKDRLSKGPSRATTTDASATRLPSTSEPNDVSLKDGVLLAIATVSLAFLNAVFLATDQEIRMPAIPGIHKPDSFAYIPFLIAHLSDFLLAWTHDRSPFIGTGDSQRTRREFGVLAMMVILRGTLRWMMGVEICGPIERAFTIGNLPHSKMDRASRLIESLVGGG